MSLELYNKKLEIEKSIKNNKDGLTIKALENALLEKDYYKFKDTIYLKR